jgi:sulfite dehydrogenase (cytochrome) subunit B
MKAFLTFSTLALLSTARAIAQEQPVSLKDAPGREVVQNNCATCHSLDYPRINSPFMDRKTWETEVNKMISAFGAPITPEDAKVIVEYLAVNYGGSG